MIDYIIMRCYNVLIFVIIILIGYSDSYVKAGPYRARRGAGTSIFGLYFAKKLVFSPPEARFRPREHHAVIRLAMRILLHKFSSKKALCSPIS